MSKTSITVREAPPRAVWALEQAGVHPLLARLYAARGVASSEELDSSLGQLLPPLGLKGIGAAAELLNRAIAENKRIIVVADYDCDGATACAVAVRGLKLLGARQVTYCVPDRMVDGYGLTPPISERVNAMGADVLVTVDNGIASIDGVARARELGLEVLITDHHLPSDKLPDAQVIVNPNQPECSFASKNLAGVGVMFYVLMALRSYQREQGVWDASTQPKLDALLPLVALGTVADVVKLDANNRRLVMQGLRRMRMGFLSAGLQALFEVASREARLVSTFDLGFALGPRINAAGRLQDMTVGIECLLTDDASRAQALAQELDSINRARRDIEVGMRERAENISNALLQEQAEMPSTLAVFDQSFHEGVVGIVASRLKDAWHRPVFVFAPSQTEPEWIKGSGRSIPGFHLRDALDWISKRAPDLFLRFGGHAMAAGCTIRRVDFEQFRQSLNQVGQAWLDAAALAKTLVTDGPLPADYRRIDMVAALNEQVWGQGFAAPLFSETVDVLSQRIVGEKHLAIRVRHQGQAIDGIWFGRTEPLNDRVCLAFRIDADTWQGRERIRFLIEGVQS